MAGEIQLNSVTLATESGGVASIDSSVDIKGPLNASGSAPIYACRAWVNFNGTGTVAIRASGNVSSITDNGGNGNYTVNFTTAMPDANYAATIGGCYSDNNAIERNFGPTTESFTTSSIKILSADMSSGGGLDVAVVSVAVFR